MLPEGGDGSIGREVRGLVIVLMYASYEKLMQDICRGLLEAAKRLRVGNKRLRPGFRLFSIHGYLASISDQNKADSLAKTGLKLLLEASKARECTINPSVFPSDGTFMKRSQVAFICDLFGLGDPGRLLREIWERLDGIVAARNAIAHGSSTPEEVGRRYTPQEMRDLVGIWEERWLSFIDNVTAKANNRDFFRKR